MLHIVRRLPVRFQIALLVLSLVLLGVGVFIYLN
jgi:hypothetical protein